MAKKTKKSKTSKSEAEPKKSKKIAKAEKVAPVTYTEALRAAPGFDLLGVDPRSTPNFDGDKAEGEQLLGPLADRIADLQERLYAESKEGGQRSVLLVVQGMDTSGKGGIMRHVIGAMDPQGIKHTAFKQPTAEERRHPFLWRIRNALPAPGQIGVFDRSHYEDVLVVRVHDLVPRATWSRRYSQINRFEKSVTDDGTTIVKVMLHISNAEQKQRLAERLDRPDKYWKFNPGDIDERERWADYMEAYQAAIDKCSTDAVPWFVVPADRKWYARLAVTNLVLEALEGLAPQWPAASFDVKEQQQRLAAT